MTDDQDHYEAYYADKLWNLLPAVYRALDSDQFNTNGPLRELVNRIGAQAAVLRRGIDRMWDDQSIETCDDWVIPYIGDLLATKLLANLDSRTTRRDVAKTIYYRRRKGTPSILEEIAFDITGWNVKVVEFFRRLGRTRHGLDPAIGLASIVDSSIVQLQQAEMLMGPRTGTSIGGLADLRKLPAASRAGSAFDEFFYTADFRQGRGQSGWYAIPNLGVFLWRLQSFGVDQTTPVESTARPGQFTFDPTGREIPLFAAATVTEGVTWTSPAEWQLPTPITPALLQPALADNPAYPLYAANEEGQTIPNSLGVFQAGSSAGDYELIAASALTTDRKDTNAATFSAPSASVSSPRFLIDPSRGRLCSLTGGMPGPLFVTYHYGFSATIGAGPYDRSIAGYLPPRPHPQLPPTTGGGQALVAGGAIGSQGTVTLNDSLTYTAMPDVTVNGGLTIRAGPRLRPVVRPAPVLVAGPP